MSAAEVYLQDLGLICALGDSQRGVAEGLFGGVSGSMTLTDDYTPGKPLPVGRVSGSLPNVDHLPAHQQNRCNQLLLGALTQVRRALEPRLADLDPLRVGVVLGTSTAGILEGERAMATKVADGKWPDSYSYQQQEMSAPSAALAQWLGVRGPAFTISTACSSGAKALASGRRLLRAGVCDLVIAGGVDVLCGLTINGFGSLESVSDQICNPFSANRKGINIGEGVALFIMSRDSGPVALSGVGETSDAHHISAPAPDGAGAARAMQGAIADAQMPADTIDYLNLHGTATPQNDRMESLAVFNSGMAAVPCSSTKAYTGHTLGAAGALEAAFCWLTLMQDRLGFPTGAGWQLPVQLWDRAQDPDNRPIDLVSEPRRVGSMRRAMSNSFAFGGNNIALVLERASEH
ncbi:beta-ketoacyl-ACP synthase [Gilvimarinus sp. F26214L]|uniref:beta-ketoacyl-ACP synthase n=1 Tax=Gilvimarinus sp. DZF01 TaxID=3461371 RepID=UPI004045DD79